MRKKTKLKSIYKKGGHSRLWQRKEKLEERRKDSKNDNKKQDF